MFKDCMRFFSRTLIQNQEWVLHVTSASWITWINLIYELLMSSVTLNKFSMSHIFGEYKKMYWYVNIRFKINIDEFYVALNIVVALFPKIAEYLGTINNSWIK